MSRLILVPLTLLLLLVLAAALLLPLLVDKERVLEFAAAALHEQTGATLTVKGETRLTVFPTLGVALSDAAITLPDKQQPDLRLRSLDIGMQFLPLLSGRIEIDTVRLDGVSARIESTQSETDARGPTGVASDAGTALAVPLALKIRHLLVTDSSVEWVDATTSTVVELVKLQMSGLNLEQIPIPVKLQLRRPGPQPVDVSLDGTISVDQQTQQVQLDDTTVVISGITARPITVHTSGAIDLAGEVADAQLALSGELFGGRLQANATLNGEQDVSTLETTGSLTGFDIANALAATASRPLLTGSATLDWQLRGRGHTANDMTTALTGPVKLTTEAVVLKGTSVENLLCQTVALTNKEALTKAFPDDTRFTTLTADIQVTDGKALLDPLRADVPGIALSGTGRFDLLTQDFDATFKARLSPELEQLDHACRASKRLIAIDWPVNCKGSAGTEPDTWCRVDAASILQDLTVNEGMEKLEKKASKLLNKLFNKGD